MNFLLPHRFKLIGALICPLGFFLWLYMQTGLLTKFLSLIFGAPIEGSSHLHAQYWFINIVIAIIGFFGFLAGLYLVSFSREKVEDERVQRTRLESFQFAALVQIISIIGGFLLMAFFPKYESEASFMLFFVLLIMLFWFSYIARFNYILHFKLKK